MRVRLTPKAARTEIQGLARDADGRTAVKARVTAAPEGGKANAALIKLLATEWGVAKSSVSIIAGASDRRKIVFLAGDPQRLGPKVDAWIDALPRL